MKKTTKNIVAIALSVIMAVGAFTTAFAKAPESGERLKLFGQELQQVEGIDKICYFAIVVDAEVLHMEDFSNVDSARETPALYGAHVGDWNILEYSVDSFENYFYSHTSEDVGGPIAIGSLFGSDTLYSTYKTGRLTETGAEEQAEIRVVRLPGGMSAENLGKWDKFVIYGNGSKANLPDRGEWASDDKGWWIQYRDGSYLVNDWWQSQSFKWYYMGPDGYMVTDTVVDGCRVGADGALVSVETGESYLDWQARIIWDHALKEEKEKQSNK